MRKSMAKLPAPVFAGVIREENAANAIAEIQNCRYGGAGMIDLHLSCLEDTGVEYVQKIVSSTSLPILALNYNGKLDWSEAGFDEEARVASLLRAVEAGAAGIDMQGYTFDIASKSGFHGEDKYSFTKNNPKEIVTDEAVIAKQMEVIDRVHTAGAEVLLSCHPGIAMQAETVVELALFLEKRGPDIIKIVTSACCEEDAFEAMRAMTLLKKEVKTPVSYHANGKHGALTRVVNPALGGHILFCVNQYRPGSTMEQLDMRTAMAAVDSLKKIL